MWNTHKMMTSSLSAHTPRLIVSFSYDKLRWSIVIGQDMVRCCCIEMIVSYTPRPPSCHTNVTCMIFRRPWRDLQPADKLQRNQTRPIQEEFGHHFCEVFEQKIYDINLVHLLYCIIWKLLVRYWCNFTLYIDLVDSLSQLKVCVFDLELWPW